MDTPTPSAGNSLFDLYQQKGLYLIGILDKKESST